MVIVPKRFVFLETPSTASRSVATTLEESVRGAKRSVCRHILPCDAPRLGLPVWTFTRHPVSHLYSWWKYGVETKALWAFTENRSKLTTFPEFTAKTFCPLPEFEADCLNIYHSVANNFWPLESGLEKFFDFLGVIPKNKHNIGEIRGQGGDFDIDLPAIELKFCRDFEIYRSATVK